MWLLCPQSHNDKKVKNEIATVNGKVDKLSKILMEKFDCLTAERAVIRGEV
jgi:hypothetical protein